MNIGWWQPSKFFVFELRMLSDIYNWFNYLASLQLRSTFCLSKGISPPSTLVLDLDPELEIPVEDKYNPLDIDSDIDLIPFEAHYLDEIDDLNIIDIYREERRIVVFNIPKHNQWAQFDYGCFKTINELQQYEIEFKSLLPQDFMTWLNLMHVVRSYINRYIWYGVRHFLFFYVYYYFPLFFYFPNYFSNFIREKYITTKFLLFNKKQNTENFKKLPAISELNLDLDFLTPYFLDKKLPWLLFKESFIFILKPFKFNFTKLNVVQNNFTKKMLFFYKNVTSEIYNHPICHNILKFFVTIEIINLAGLFSVFLFETFSVFSFFEKKNQRQISLFLEKNKKTENKQLFNDQEFFWPIITEFNIKKGPFKLKKPRGWPKKKKLFYFDSEADIFIKKKYLLTRSTDVKRYFFFINNIYALHKNFIVLQIIKIMLLCFKKPF